MRGNVSTRDIVGFSRWLQHASIMKGVDDHAVRERARRGAGTAVTHLPMLT
ncbi:MAG: hypothetical protein AVDCRST_MAG43-998 [uncultured Thermomicrobiales bacterium]|uniref:Uncharacterized protein n=1 Tax=uncultured Thermomicrobiales bacterium TaxID=1645740 RepID=A0A6J4UI62_9BACT|nr:MAG: hypothetical protein AVDCRST_MAG43-998 [uncultured Thermomicrobiales bacterium]